MSTMPSYPQDVTAEMGVLSSLVLSPAATMEILNSLGVCPEWFQLNAPHKTIYETITGMLTKGVPVDFVTITSELSRHGRLEAVGGAIKITQLFTHLPTAANVAFYAETVRDKWIMRATIDSCTDLITLAYGPTSAHEVASELEIASAMVSMRTRGKKRRASTARVVDELMRKIYENKREELFGLSTGFDMLDRLIGGVMKGDMILVQGERGSGKSAFALNLADNYDRKHLLGCTYCTFEMTAEQQIKRLIQLRSGCNIREALDTQTDMLQASPIELINEAAQSVRKGRLDFYDAPRSSIDDCLGELRRRASSGNLGLGVLDYDELLDLKCGKGKSKEEALSDIAAGWKSVAGELGIATILLSQVTLDKDGRARSRWSTSKENFANVILTVKEGEDGSRTVSIDKNRDGKKGGVIRFNFLGKTTKFTESGLVQ